MKVNFSELSAELNKDDYEAIARISQIELIQLFSNQIAFWRWKNIVRIFKKFQKICEENNLHPQKVAPKFLIPFFEGASQEEDESIQEIWAKILAEETIKPGTISVRTLNTLKELSKVEAELLEEISDDLLQMGNGTWRCYRYDENDISKLLALSDAGILSPNTDLITNLDLSPDDEAIELISDKCSTRIIMAKALPSNRAGAEAVRLVVPIYSLTMAGNELCSALYREKNGGVSFAKMVEDLKKRNQGIDFWIKEAGDTGK